MAKFAEHPTEDNVRVLPRVFSRPEGADSLSIIRGEPDGRDTQGWPGSGGLDDVTGLPALICCTSNGPTADGRLPLGADAVVVSWNWVQLSRCSLPLEAGPPRLLDNRARDEM